MSQGQSSEELQPKKEHGGDLQSLTKLGNFVDRMNKLGATVVRVGPVQVDFRRPFPTAADASQPRRERHSADGDVEVYDAEEHVPAGNPAPRDEFETWFDSPPMPTGLK